MTGGAMRQLQRRSRSETFQNTAHVLPASRDSPK